MWIMVSAELWRWRAVWPVEPGEGTFDDPAFGQDLEAFLLAAFDHLDGITEHLLSPVDQGSGVSAVDEDGGDGFEAAEQPHRHGSCRYPVLDAGPSGRSPPAGCPACLPRCGACGP